MSAEAAYLPLFIFLIVIFIFFYLFRAFLKFNKEKKKTEQKDTSQVGFVVDTFHGLVSKLKEKERELEVLKKLAEQRAGDVESYNRNILQSVPSGVISFDKDLRIKTMNSSAEKILGIKAEDAIERNCEELFKNPVAKLLKEGKPIERGEVQYKLPDGRELWLGLTFSPLRDNEGKEIGNILVFTDLTELKALESQAELRKRLSSLGEMSAGIAHELRNPLGVIAGYTKLLSRKADAALIPTVEAISREIEVMDRIISDFLSFARPVELTLSKINLSEIISSCVSNIAGVSGPDIIGEVLLDIDKSVFISGDEILLRQAFTNLIQNATDAMKDGGRLSFGYAKSGSYAEITVSDTGHGIPEGIKDKIFLPFYTTKEKGTGLGLAIVHKIIVSHGGSVSVERADKGTIFRIKLQAS